MPVLLRIGNLISCHPTKKFLQYLDSLNELEKRVRKGQNFMLQIQNLVATAEDMDDDDSTDENCNVIGEGDDDIEDDDTGNDDDAGNDEDHVKDVQAGDHFIDEFYMDDNSREENANESQDTVRQDETSQEESVLDAGTSRKRKFGQIVFKQGLRTKGRPKKKTKQFGFNKTAVDKKKGKKMTQKNQMQKKTNYIDDSESSEADVEEDLSLILDDDSNDDLSEEEDLSEIHFKCSICWKSIFQEECKGLFLQVCYDESGCINCIEVAGENNPM